MANLGISTKKLAISKSNTQMVAVVALASFLSVFCLIASQTVWSQNHYQSHVIAKKEIANKNIKDNIKSFDALSSSYEAFNSEPVNKIGGSITGNGDNDGSNSKLILDALPSVYDFPGLTSSIEKILTDRQFKITSITGVDDQLKQQANLTSPTPKQVSMPFSFSVSNASYASVQQLITALQLSIRPIVIDSLSLSGGSTDMTLTVNAHTYYQPAKNLTITKQVVK